MSEPTIIEKLLPCPFCGGEARDRLYVRDGGKVQCPNPGCYASVTQFNPDGAAKAIAAWNTRAADPDVKALVEALESMLERERRRYDENDERSMFYFHKNNEKELTALRNISGGDDEVRPI